MNNAWKPNQPQHPTAAEHSPKWRHMKEQNLPCKTRLVAVKGVQTVRQKWLIAGKIRWCDYS